LWSCCCPSANIFRTMSEVYINICQQRNNFIHHIQILMYIFNRLVCVLNCTYQIWDFIKAQKNTHTGLVSLDLGVHYTIPCSPIYQYWECLPSQWVFIKPATNQCSIMKWCTILSTSLSLSFASTNKLWHQLDIGYMIAM
jgi:hypothetical protein